MSRSGPDEKEEGQSRQREKQEGLEQSTGSFALDNCQASGLSVCGASVRRCGWRVCRAQVGVMSLGDQSGTRSGEDLGSSGLGEGTYCCLGRRWKEGLGIRTIRKYNREPISRKSVISYFFGNNFAHMHLEITSWYLRAGDNLA